MSKKFLLKFLNTGYIKHSVIILFFTIATLVFTGYRYGDGDQNSHIPFLLKIINPKLYPNNDFVELRNFHYAYFWLLLAPIIKILPVNIEIIFFLIFLFSLFILFQAYFSLIFVFTKNKKASYIGLLTFIIPVFSFTIFPTHETYLVNRVFALPLLVFSINYFLENKYIRAFILLGITGNFHFILSAFVCAMFVTYFLIKINKKNLQRLAFFAFTFLLFSLPVLIWRLNTSGLNFSINYEWYKIISNGALGHLFHIFSFNPPTILLTILGIGNTLVVIWVYRKKILDKSASQIDEKLKSFFIAIYLILFLAFITAEFFPLTTAIQFQLSRVGTFIPILAYPYFFAFLYQQLKKRVVKRSDFNLLIFLLSVSGSLVFPFIAFFYRIKQWVKKLILLFTLILLIFATKTLIKSGEWKPGIYIYIQDSPWYQVQLWAKKNSKVEDIFITPIDKWGHYYPDFMLGSQRSTLVTLGELMEIAFHPNFIANWKKRFEDVVPQTLEKFKGDFLQNKKIARNAYNKNSTEDFKRVADKYKASYIVVEKPNQLKLKRVYENEEFRIYRLDFRR